jgi:peptidoglycan/LPS O-acetylase OafA/YrhL
LRAFYTRRARRLVPALIVMLAVTFVAYRFVVPHASAAGETLRGVPASIFYIANWLPALGISNLGFLGHMWSLSVEEHFYLLWPLLFGALWSSSPRRTARRVAFACVVAALWRVLLLMHGAGTNRLYLGTDARAEELLMGCLLATAMTTGFLHAVAARRVLRAGLVTASLAILAAVMVALPVHSRWLPRGGSTLIELAAAIVIAHLVLFPNSVGGRVLTWRPLVWVGRRSYGMYLWHLPLTGLAGAVIRVGTPLARAEFVALVWCATLVCAALSYRYIERPWLRSRSTTRVAAIDLRDQEPATGEQSVAAQSLARAV